MRRTQIALALATTLLLGLTAVPVMAVPNQPVGERVNLLLGDQTFPASTPFHIDHGFGHEVGDTAIGLSDFMLDMDGTVLDCGLRPARFPGRRRADVLQALVLQLPLRFDWESRIHSSLHPGVQQRHVPCDGNRIDTPVEASPSPQP